MSGIVFPSFIHFNSVFPCLTRPKSDVILNDVPACLCSVQVWDVLQEEALSNYRGHIGYLLCVDWSPVDPDVIWTGGKDFTLQEWRVSKQEFTKPPKGKHLSLQHSWTTQNHSLQQ